MRIYFARVGFAR